MKTRFAIGFAFALGIALGFFLVRPAMVHAQSGGVTVTKVPMVGGNGLTFVRGSIVGFSCLPDGEGNATCYVASQ